MIQRNDILSIPYLKKAAFSGSFQGMRYRLKKKEAETEPAEDGREPARETFLGVTAWEGPYSYEATPKDGMEERDFPFSEEGIIEAVDWLNQMWQAQPERWKKAAGNW